MFADKTVELVATIHNAAWWVRYYCRPHQVAQRAKAVRVMGLAVRAAFNATEDFGPLLDALRSLV